MNINELKQQLIEDEGVKYEIYKDSLGYLTFGIGHLITRTDPEYGMPVGTPVSEDRVFKVFEQDVDLILNECYVLYGPGPFFGFPEEVRQVLANMMFNLGRGKLSKFVNFNGEIFRHNWKAAAAHGRDSLWWKEQVPNRAERLMSRLEQVPDSIEDILIAQAQDRRNG